MPIAGMEAARLGLRQVGYCIVCDRMVERRADGSCPAGHPAPAVSGRIMVDVDEAIPQLPRFNVGAFAVPFVWGPGHGQWVGLFFFPIWLFVDSIIRTAIRGPWQLKLAAALVLAVTLAFESHFAVRANGLAWRRVCGRLELKEFVRRERLWTAAMVPLGVLFIGWAIGYDLMFLQ